MKLKTIFKKIKYLRRIVAMQPDIEQMSYMQHYDFLQKHLYNNPKYQDDRKLNKYEFQVFSQSGEDGIIREIFERIGVTNRTFVEFGVGNGLQNNTVNLLSQRWRGFWIDGSKDYVEFIQNKFKTFIDAGELRLFHERITAEGIEAIFDSIGVPDEFDLLSIDIDGNDYWVWKAIEKYSPRVVVIEYNSAFPPPVKWVIKYRPEYVWDGTQYFGASLKSMEALGEEKGYKLVGSTFSGINAFFVREDLVADKFLEPFTAENHYESPKYFVPKIYGHPKNVGPFLQI
ncbi:MAG TPA: hypothetical protein ENJ29_00695 [Bacteroidetes bacterium]|nr:hypothetical protein [Bacteroidota bacterium]